MNDSLREKAYMILDAAHREGLDVPLMNRAEAVRYILALAAGITSEMDMYDTGPCLHRATEVLEGGEERCVVCGKTVGRWRMTEYDGEVEPLYRIS